MNRRSGFSLVELLAVISIATVLLSLLGSVLHKTLQQQHASVRSLTFQRTASRLSHAFRRDVHAAHDVSLDDTTLTLNSPNGTIVYRTEGSTVARKATNDMTTHHDEFDLPAGCPATFRLSANQARATLELTLCNRDFGISPTNVEEAPPKQLPITASVGRDNRLATEGAILSADKAPTP